MKAKKVTPKEIKAVNNLFAIEMLSPFKVLNWINTNRQKTLEDGTKVADLLLTLGVKKLTLDDLFNHVDGYGNKVVAKLVRYNSRITNYLDVRVINNSTYYVVPVRYTITDFFKSLNDAIAEKSGEHELLTSSQKEYVKMFTKLLADKEKESTKEAQKVVKALKQIPTYQCLSDAELLETALKMLAA